MLDHKKLKALKLKCHDLGMEMQDLRKFMHYVRTYRLILPLGTLLTWDKLDMIILKSFKWSETPEGHDYWSAIRHKYIK